MMRFLLRASIPTDAGNDLLRDPEFGKRMEGMLADIHPEAVYFCLENGQRTVYMVITAEDTSELPRFAEPIWLGLQADVELIPAMTLEDFGKAQTHIQAAVQKYA
jgi:hypothetical protein